jgi:hypothetical protein
LRPLFLCYKNKELVYFRELSYGGMPIAELRHLTGRIEELYVAMMTLGQLADSVNQRGYDVVSSTGRLCCTKIS